MEKPYNRHSIRIKEYDYSKEGYYFITICTQNIIRIFKTYTTKKYYEININVNGKLWQRNYYEHIIRNEKEYLHILEYIENNPINWEKDEYNC